MSSHTEVVPPRGFLHESPGYAIPCYIFYVLMAATGTFGNITILVLIYSKKRLRNTESIFITNLAIADMYVTAVADPMSLLAKLEGEHLFDRYPGLCQTVGSMCTVSCATSLCTIGVLSLNRYVYICRHSIYKKIFTKRNSIGICICLYFIGATLVTLNMFDVGDHNFDRKSLECIWDRMATFEYTVVFAVGLVWTPCLIIGICFLRILFYVRRHGNRVQQHGGSNSTRISSRSVHLAKTLFVIYIVFFSCWMPYALLMILDTKNTFSRELHVYVTMWAHLHPSLTWIIYFFTNKNFTQAYRELFHSCTKWCRQGENAVVPLQVNKGNSDANGGSNAQISNTSNTYISHISPFTILNSRQLANIQPSTRTFNTFKI